MKFEVKQQKMNHLALITHLLPLTKVDSAGLRWTLEVHVNSALWARIEKNTNKIVIQSFTVPRAKE